jgi:hypothetical protein
LDRESKSHSLRKWQTAESWTGNVGTTTDDSDAAVAHTLNGHPGRQHVTHTVEESLKCIRRDLHSGIITPAPRTSWITYKWR